MKWDQLVKKVMKFKEFGTSTTTYHRDIENQSIPFYVNEFWTAKQRAAHRLHEISYRACFKPQLPRFFIDRLTKVGDRVYDPFMGRGTTLLEAALRHRKVAGNDVNPLSKILCQPRLQPPSMHEVEQRLKEMPWDQVVQMDQEFESDLEVFFHPQTLMQLKSIRQFWLERQNDRTFDSVDAWIRMVTTNRLTGHSNGFLSVYTMPPNQAVTADRQRLINEKRNQQPEARNVEAIILKKSRNLLKTLEAKELKQLSKSDPQLSTGLADNTSFLADNSVNLVVTSPPFLDIVDYRTDNWMRCWFNGIDESALSIWQLNKVPLWVEKMAGVFRELQRVLKPEGWIAFEVGEVKKGKVLMEDMVVQAVQGTGLQVRGVLINDQQFTKTANCWGVNNQQAGTNTNRIVMIQQAE